MNITVLGGGSNVLISDLGVKGLVICLQKFKGIKEELKEQELHVYANAGASKLDLMRVFLKYKLAPAIFLSGLPGDVGGGVVMNAGVSGDCKPKEFNEILHSIDFLSYDLKTFSILKKDIKWEYRSADLPSRALVVGASLFGFKKRRECFN